MPESWGLLRTLVSTQLEYLSLNQARLFGASRENMVVPASYFGLDPRRFPPCSLFYLLFFILFFPVALPAGTRHTSII
jgi:hypothetical protein